MVSWRFFFFFFFFCARAAGGCLAACQLQCHVAVAAHVHSSVFIIAYSTYFMFNDTLSGAYLGLELEHVTHDDLRHLNQPVCPRMRPHWH